MITIRAMVKTDLAGVAAIESENPSPWSAGLLAEELQIQELGIVHAVHLVAEDAGAHILGWCACRVIQPEAELLKIAVRRKSRECGIGRFLLEHLLAILRKKKITSLFLEVRSNNRVALDFYEKQGFLHVGNRPNYYTDPPDSARILQKNLSW